MWHMTSAKQPPEAQPTRPRRKDRLIQTRVPRDLETTLKEEARRRRLTVSHLIRNILEDTFELVDGVVADVDQIVADSVSLARSLGRSARRLTTAEPGDEPASGEPADDLPHVYAWNEVVLHRPAACSRCGTEIGRGQRGFVGMREDRSRPLEWLCGECIETL
jgi:hypothetical protein